MKTGPSASRGEQGNLLLVVLILGAIAGLTLGSYLLMAQQQNMSIYRSQGWNSAMAVAEAGVEDGLQMVNWYAGSFKPLDLPRWIEHASGAGWQVVAPNTYYVKRYIADALSPTTFLTNSYEVWIYNTNDKPAIYAEGTVPWINLHASANQPIFAQITTAARPNTTPLVRKVLARTVPQPLFTLAMAADLNIDLRGRRVRSNSFDSSKPEWSTNHKYDPNKTRDNGDIATNAGFLDAMNIGNAHIRGKIRTGPGSNTININSGAVGDSNYVATAKGGSVQDGWSSTDFNVDFAEVIVPDYSWMPLSPWKADGSYFIDKGGEYRINNLSAGLTVDAPAGSVVQIRIDGDVYLSGAENITITPTGAQVIIYMTGTTFSLTGGAIIDNQSGIAANFFLYGDPNCKLIRFGGNASFYGGIYAPQADFFMGGGGADDYDFVGASVTRTVTMLGHYNFHFDEDLARVGPTQGYLPTGWQEL